MELDPYELRHLVAHLESAGNTVELHRLLAASTDDGRNLWFGLKDTHGDVDGYRRDVDRALHMVRRAVDAELDEGRTTPEIAREIHYVLLAASASDQVKNTPPALFAALVAKGVWSPEAGLAAAAGDLDTVTSLLPHLPREVAERAAQEAMASVSRLADDLDRAQCLGQLAPFLPAGHINQVLDLLAALPTSLRHIPVAPLAGWFPADRMHSVVDLVAEIDNGLEMSAALAAIGPRVPDDVVSAAEAAANMIADPDERAVAMSGIADRLDVAVLHGLLTAMTASPGNGATRVRALTLLRPSLLGGLLAAAMAAADAATGLFRLDALAAIAPALPPELAATALRTALDADYRSGKDALIVALIPRLPTQDVLVVLQDARRRSSHEVLTAVALTLPPPERDQVLGEAFDIFEARPKRWSGAVDGYYASPDHLREARILTELPSKFLGRAVELAERMTPEMAVALADRLSRAGRDAERERMLRTVLRAIRDFEDEHGSRARAMATLAPALSRQLLWEALTEAGTASEGWFYGEDWHGVRAVRARIEHLAPHLDAHQLRAALSMVRELRDDAERSKTLTKLLPHLSQPARASALDRTLALTYKIIDSYERRSCMAELAPHLSPQLFNEHLAVAAEIRNPEIRASAIAMLSEHIPAKLVRRAARLLTNNPYTGWTSLAYARLALRTAGWRRKRLYRRAVADYDKTGSDDAGAGDDQILRALLAAAPDKLVPDLRARAHRVHFRDRALFLADMAARLTGPARTEALAAALTSARQVERIEYRAQILGTLGEDVPGALAAIDEIDDPVHYQVALAALGRPVSAESILEVERRWRTRPADADDSFRVTVNAYINLAGRAPTDLMPHLIAAARDLPSPTDRAELVTALAPKLPQELLPAALAILTDINQGHAALASARVQTGAVLAREYALSALAALATRFHHLPLPQQKQLWTAARSALAMDRRADALTALAAVADMVALAGGDSGIEESVRAIFTIGEWFP